MFDLKPLHREAIGKALEKAERYRLLNEPAEAESICLDILKVDPGHQQALVVLLLSLTDQIGEAPDASARARAMLPRLQSDYERHYYSGIIFERRAKAHCRTGGPGCGPTAYELFREAMSCYEQAEVIHPPGNDDAILRWNTVARIIMTNPDLRPAAELAGELPLE